jgi:NitT/TauT family transport system substrate-binding protein
MDNVHIRFLRYSAFYTPLLLTLTGDRLRTEGLTATYDKVTPERTIDAGLREGSVQVAQSAPAVNFLPALKGEPPPYRHFALLNARDGFFLAARDRAIPFTWRSLEGRTVLVDHFFQPHALFRAALRLQGVEEAQVRIVDAGDVASIEAAFRAGVGDFVHMQGPAPQQLEREGLGRVVASVGAAVGPLAFSSLCARPEWLQTEVARAFMRAFRAARVAAQVTPAGELARILASFFPDVPTEALATTISAYQELKTWIGDVQVTQDLHDRTVGIFMRAGYIQEAPIMSDVFAPSPE